MKFYFGDELKSNATPDMSPRSMTSDILIHRIAGLITNNTDSVLLSFFKNLALNSVTIYTSYNTVIMYPITLVMRLIDSMRATLAIKINEDSDNSYKYYREVFSFSKYCVLIVIPIFISQVNDFISLWIGCEYLLNPFDIVLFSLFGIHKLLIPTIYATRDAKGLYKESKIYSVAQAIVNMVLSLLLIKPLGITGVLIGTVVCDWLVLEPFNIKLVFSKVFKKKFDMGINYLGLFVFIGIMSSIGSCINRIPLAQSLT